MKDTMRIVTIFALVMVLLLVLAWVVGQITGSKDDEEPVQTAQDEKSSADLNEMNEAGAAVITLAGGTASVSGLGAQADGSGVAIVYPGTYRLEGTLTDGTVTVDLGDYSGAVYLILNGASVSSSSGPAVHVVQAGLTVIRLAEGTQNSLSDGADYVIETNGEVHTGGAVYSADDLRIEGSGTLTVTGNAADGIRVKDSLTITGGALNITAADDGIQVNDTCTIEGGSLLIGSGGDGISVTLGSLDVSGGSLWINSSGDVMAAFTDIGISGGSINATSYGGSTLYSVIAMNDISAKGLKAESITVSGGTIDLDTADDCLHAGRTVTVSGGVLTLASGDDAVHAGTLAELRNVTLDVTSCYEGIEADEVRMGNIWARIYADSNGIDAGETGCFLEDGTLIVRAPRAFGSEGMLSLGGTVTADCDGSKSPLSFVSAEIPGTLTLTCSTSDGRLVIEDGELPASLLFVPDGGIPEGTEVSLLDAAGTVLRSTAAAGENEAFLFAGSDLVPGQTYTFTAGDYTYSAAVGEGCTVTPELPAVVSASGEMTRAGSPS